MPQFFKNLLWLAMSFYFKVYGAKAEAFVQLWTVKDMGQEGSRIIRWEEAKFVNIDSC